MSVQIFKQIQTATFCTLQKIKRTFVHKLNSKNLTFSEIPEVSGITLNFRPLEGFNPVFWHNLNNLYIKKGIYAKEKKLCL